MFKKQEAPRLAFPQATRTIDTPNGLGTVLLVDDAFWDNDPLVRANPDAFGPVPVVIRRSEPTDT